MVKYPETNNKQKDLNPPETLGIAIYKVNWYYYFISTLATFWEHSPSWRKSENCLPGR